jgi:hypothetical protein
MRISQFTQWRHLRLLGRFEPLHEALRLRSQLDVSRMGPVHGKL